MQFAYIDVYISSAIIEELNKSETTNEEGKKIKGESVLLRIRYI